MDVLGHATLSSQFALFYHTRRLSRRLVLMARSSGTPTAFSRIAAGHVADLAIPVVMLLAVLVVLAPVPASVVDLLLSANLTVAVLALLGSLAARTPLEMAVFPSFLLTATLVRLVLNIATTRLILSQAGTVGSGAAGDVVQAFSSFVAADNLVVGIVVFSIIAVIQFVVLTAGATRTSEVAARFTLDALPGRQAAIDAEVSSGGLSRNDARKLRGELQQQAEFYASMDGASRFVRGEAVASVVIVLVNLVGGFAIGVGQLGLPATEAAGLYTRLTIGDGLASAVPSLLVSVATGLLLSRSTMRQNLPRELGRQLFARPALLVVTAVFLGLLALSDLPTVPLAIMAVGTAIAAWLFRSTALKSISRQSSNRGGKSAQKVASPMDTILSQSRLVVRVGNDLVSLIAEERSGLPAAVEGVRKRIAEDLGVIVPAVLFRDDATLDKGQWVMELDSDPIDDSVMPSGRWLLVPSSDDEVTHRRWREKRVAADAVLPARCVRWGSPAEAEEVTGRGGRAFIGADAIAYMFEQNLRRCVDRLLSRDQMARMLESLRSTEPATVEQTVPDVVSVATVQRTLQCLLREGLPIKPLAVLLEAIADHASEGCLPEQLAEKLRSHIDRTIVRRLRDNEGRLTIIEVTPRAAELLIASESEVASRLEQKRLLAELQRALRPLQDRGRRCAISVAQKDRGAFAQYMRAAGIMTAVVADSELQGQPGLEIFTTINASGSSIPGGSRAA